MIVNILTLFPEIYKEIINCSIFGKLIKKHKVKINIIDISKNKTFRTDDKVYGCYGMLMKADYVYDIVANIKHGKIIIMSPQGQNLSVNVINNIIKNKVITIICPRYDGIDHRISILLDINYISIGDYVLFDGDIPCMVLLQSIIRYKYFDKDRIIDDSFHKKNVIESDNFTRPKSILGIQVPKVLYSGDHKKISEWKRISSIKNTKLKQKYNL